MTSLSIRETAEALDVSIPTIRNWINSGKLEAEKMLGPHGPEYRISQDEINRVNGEQTEKTIIIHQEQTDPVIEVPSSWLLSQLTGSIKAEIQEIIRVEVNSIKDVIRDEVRQELAASEERIATRDKQLMEVLRGLQEVREQEAAARKGWLSRLFIRG